jgi:hypothetical protein
MLWLAATIASLQLVLFGFGSGLLGFRIGAFLGISWAFGLVVLALSGSIFAWVASRFFIEARRTGELDLLATTPLGAQEIVSTQWSILKRWLTGPVLLMLAPVVLQAATLLFQIYSPGPPSFWRHYYGASLLLNALNTVLRTGALCWVGLWCGLRADNQARAILWTLLLVEAPPYLVSLGWGFLFRSFIVAGAGLSPWIFGYLVPPAVAVLYFLWLISLARRQLGKGIASAEPFSPGQLFSDGWPRLGSVIRSARQWPVAQH